MSEKKTGAQAASDASAVLRDGRTAQDSKSAAGSALSQVNSGRSTSDDAAESASTQQQGRR